MVDHIYGRSNIITRTDRPNMFIKELNLYIDYLRKKKTETISINKHHPEIHKISRNFIAPRRKNNPVCSFWRPRGGLRGLLDVDAR